MSSDTEPRKDKDPLRTGIFGVVLVVCVVLVAFGYTTLPFWPQGRGYTAYFSDAGGITPGNDVYVSGIKVGKVQSVSLAGDAARVDFTVDRHVNVGNQSLAAIRTETILGQRSVGGDAGREWHGYHDPAESDNHPPTHWAPLWRIWATTPGTWTRRSSRNR